MIFQGGHTVRRLGYPAFILYSDFNSDLSGLECDSIEDAREKIAASDRIYGPTGLAVYRRVDD